jgi:hypothetical protein
MTHSLVELRHALAWLESLQFTDNTRGLAISILADLVANELSWAHETAQRADDLSARAKAASSPELLGGAQ